MPYLIKHPSGIYYAQRKVAERLQAAVARIIGRGRDRQVYLKRSLGTTVLSQANISIKPVLIEFDRIIRAAEALENSKPPIRTTLTVPEIERMAEYVHGEALRWDERLRVGGRDEMARMLKAIRKEAAAEGENPDDIKPAYAYSALPPHGLSAQQLADNREQLVEDLKGMREALAMGDISAVMDQTADALDTFGINLDPKSRSCSTLGIAVLRAYVRALEDIEKRNAGHPVETPAPPHAPLSTPASGGGTLREAFDGWETARARPDDTVSEYKRAVEMFVQLHGNLTVADIKRRHALEYRDAIRLVPSRRAGKLREAPLPEVAAWGKAHPEAPKVSPGTVNKQLGALQAVGIWGHDNGLITDDVRWYDPFQRLRVEEDRSERGPFAIGELQKVFDAPLFTAHEWPVGARGAAGVWLPLLSLFTGARQSELAGLKVSNIRQDEASGAALIYIVSDRKTGRRLKNKSSERVVPVHQQLVKVGFLKFVVERRRESPDAWLFPLISLASGRAGVKAWSKWWGGYLRTTVGIEDTSKVFHSFRHGVTDALRRGKVDFELREALVGHSQDSTVSGGYGASEMLSRWGVKALQQAVSKISYPGLDLSRVRPLGKIRRKRSAARQAV
jgi:integrase